MPTIEGPLRSPDELDALEPLWEELHSHELAVATYRPLETDLAASWTRRRELYEQLLGEDGALFVARDGGTAIGYAVTRTLPGLDDTFDVIGGVVELLSLVVSASARGNGVGRSLIEAVQRFSAEQGIDTLKVAVMVGNDGARRLYEKMGFVIAEEVLYLKAGDRR